MFWCAVFYFLLSLGTNIRNTLPLLCTPRAYSPDQPVTLLTWIPCPWENALDTVLSLCTQSSALTLLYPWGVCCTLLDMDKIYWKLCTALLVGGLLVPWPVYSDIQHVRTWHSSVTWDSLHSWGTFLACMMTSMDQLWPRQLSELHPHHHQWGLNLSLEIWVTYWVIFLGSYPRVFR